MMMENEEKKIKPRKPAKPRAKKPALVTQTISTEPTTEKQKIDEFFEKLELRTGEDSADYPYLLNRIFRVDIVEKNHYSFEFSDLNFYDNGKKITIGSGRTQLQAIGLSVSDTIPIKNSFFHYKNPLESEIIKHMVKPASTKVESYKVSFLLKERNKSNQVWITLYEDGEFKDIPDFIKEDQIFSQLEKEIDIICNNLQKKIEVLNQ